VPQIITVNDDRYLVLGMVPVNDNYSPEQLKQEWKADTVLRNGNNFYLADKLIEAEFEDID
jgi:hypothetical protein